MSEIKLTEKEKEAIREFLESKNLPADKALTFKDVAIPDQYSEKRTRSEINDFRTELVPDELTLNIPFISANMASVSGSEMIIAMEREGGLGIPFQGLSLDNRLDILESVRRSDCALIEDPAVVSPDLSLAEAKEEMEKFGVSSVIVIDEDNKPVGILSKRDWLYEEDDTGRVEEYMTEDVIVAPRDIDFEDAKDLIRENKVEKLPLVDDDGRLAGLVTAHGLFYDRLYPRALRNSQGQFIRVGSVGVGRQFTDRRLQVVERQVDAGISALLIDTARAHSINTKEVIEGVKDKFPDLPLIVGNVSTPEGAKFLFELGVDVVKVGVGPGHACKTREVGVGVPQLTAVAECSVIARRYNKSIIADGGVSSPGDAAKALIAGADAIMAGRLFVGTWESAAESKLVYSADLDDYVLVKEYEGSASFSAQKKRRDQGTLKEIRRPEGESMDVAVRGPLSGVVQDLLDGLSSAMSYVGAGSIDELRENGTFVRQTREGFTEGKPENQRS